MAVEICDMRFNRIEQGNNGAKLQFRNTFLELSVKIHAKVTDKAEGKCNDFIAFKQPGWPIALPYSSASVPVIDLIP
jgi:hypothetical protein